MSSMVNSCKLHSALQQSLSSAKTSSEFSK